MTDSASVPPVLHDARPQPASPGMEGRGGGGGLIASHCDTASRRGLEQGSLQVEDVLLYYGMACDLYNP